MAFYEAQAALCGIARYPNLRGTVHIFPKDCGSVVQVTLSGGSVTLRPWECITAIKKA